MRNKRQRQVVKGPLLVSLRGFQQSWSHRKPLNKFLLRQDHQATCCKMSTLHNLYASFVLLFLLFICFNNNNKKVNLRFCRNVSILWNPNPSAGDKAGAGTHQPELEPGSDTLSGNSCSEHLCWMREHGSLATFSVPICRHGWLPIHKSGLLPQCVSARKVTVSSSNLGNHDGVFSGRCRDTYPPKLGTVNCIAAQSSPCALDREDEEGSSGGRGAAARVPGFKQDDFPGTAVEESLVRSLTTRSRLPLRKLTEPQKVAPRALNDSKVVIFFQEKRLG